MDSQDKLTVWMAIFVVVFLLGVIVYAVSQPYFEMRAFNKFSETKATYWDAVMSDLRIIPN